jgi:hypothetical protein
MNRRHFLTLSGAAGLTAMASPTHAVEGSAGGGRDIYELRQFIIDNEKQKKLLDGFFKEAAIPALNRLGMKPVGVFYPSEGISPIYVLMRYPSMQAVVELGSRLAEDSSFVAGASEFLEAPASAPAFKRMESSVMIAFEGMPKLETPVLSAGRVLQLRIYESPGVMQGLKKIEMFNEAGEIKLFRESGLNPVFFGQTIVGSKMPNLTYMLAFKSMDDQKAAWKKFVSHPEWKRISGMPEYSDKTILSNITNLPLIPAEYSQI